MQVLFFNLSQFITGYPAFFLCRSFGFQAKKQIHAFSFFLVTFLLKFSLVQILQEVYNAKMEKETDRLRYQGR